MVIIIPTGPSQLLHQISSKYHYIGYDYHCPVTTLLNNLDKRQEEEEEQVVIHFHDSLVECDLYKYTPVNPL